MVAGAVRGVLANAGDGTLVTVCGARGGRGRSQALAPSPSPALQKQPHEIGGAPGAPWAHLLAPNET